MITNMQDEDGNTALHLAHVKDRADVVQVLQENGARWDIKNRKNQDVATFREECRKKPLYELSSDRKSLSKRCHLL